MVASSLCSLLLLLVLTNSSWAAEAGVNLQAEQVTYQRDQELIIATGEAHLQAPEIELEANRIEINLKQNQLVAKGQVTTNRDTTEYTSQRVEYDLETDQGVFIDSQGTFTSASLNSPLYLQTPKTDYSPQQSKLSTPQFTSCELEEPHYHFQAQQMVIYPGDRIVAYHASFWEFNGQIPLFYWPILVYSLQHNQQVFQPQLGYNRQKGWFVKTTYNYYLESDFGQLYVDYFSELGWAIGAKHYYKNLEDDRASLYLYLEQDRQHPKQSPWVNFSFERHYETEQTNRDLTLDYQDHYGDYLSQPQKAHQVELAFDQQLDLGNWETALGLDYNRNQSYNHHLDLQLGLDKLPREPTADRFDLDLDYSYEEQPSSRLDDYQAQLEYQTYLTDDLSLNYDYTYNYRREEETKSWDYDTSLQLQETQPSYEWWLGTSLQRTEEEIDYYNLPEGEVTVKPGVIWSAEIWDPLEVTLGGVNKYQVDWPAAKQHGYYQLDYSDYFQLGKYNNIYYDQQFQQNMYSTDHLNWSYSNDFNLQTRLPAGWSNRVTYDYQTVSNSAPEGFFTPDEKHQITEKLSWHQGESDFYIKSGYDLVTGEYDDLTSEVEYSREHYSLEAVTEYDLNEQQFNESATSLTVDYDRLQYDTAARWDLNTGSLVQWDNSLQFKVGRSARQWQVEVNSSYDLADQKFKEANLELAKRLHRRKLTVAYNHLQEEVWVQYQILAFSDKGLKLGTGSEGEMLFDSDLGRILDEVE
ncbi:LPS-assembly protein LptD [Halanaerobaculum tunisiense]